MGTLDRSRFLFFAREKNHWGDDSLTLLELDIDTTYLKIKAFDIEREFHSTFYYDSNAKRFRLSDYGWEFIKKGYNAFELLSENDRNEIPELLIPNSLGLVTDIRRIS